jgi:hypothetical protein
MHTRWAMTEGKCEWGPWDELGATGSIPRTIMPCLVGKELTRVLCSDGKVF